MFVFICRFCVKMERPLPYHSLPLCVIGPLKTKCAGAQRQDRMESSMSNMRFEKTGKKKHKGTKGFYVALGVCLVAVGAAAWTTYDSVKDYMAPATSSSVSSAAPAQSQSDAQAGATVSGVPKDAASSASGKAESKAPSTTSSKEEAASKASASSSSSSKETTSKAASSKAETSSEAKPTVAENSLVIYPVGKTVTKPYSKGEPVKSLTFGDWRVHNGVDLSAKKGDSVKAMANGTVQEVKSDPMLGKTIVIDHGAFTASYCGLGDTVLVKKGDTVEVGQEIGSIKEVPSEIVEESHLHLEVTKDGKYVDPLSVMTQQ